MQEENKSQKSELPSQYNPKEVEPAIYKLWEKGNFFKPKIQPNKKPFVVTIPPPNVTGSLHMGHALNNTVIDILIRYNRMKQIPTLYQPGTDHAGIATQFKVEQKLAKEGKSRQDLGREKFEKEIWKWIDKYQTRITDQLKTLGCSCDWSRERFTLDKKYSEAVNTAFKHYYDKGLIYKGTRVINWCPRCQTSISDLEINYVPKIAKLYYFKYDKKFPITIATTRPETKLGDTGVAVNPNDERYKKFIGKTFEINFAGQKRKIKIISDRSIDPKFGTGAVGLTPAHSFIDEKIANANDLKNIQVIDENGKMTENAGLEFKGLKVKEAREKVVSWLEKNNLLEKIEEIENNLATCDRCGYPIEPIPSKQWFLKMKELAKPAIDVVKSGKIKFYPSRWKKVYINWLENINDWCISRQIWWGHKIPLDGETDVLDTWFSSALWPFAVFGWPEKSKDLEYFYPTSTLSTARDIIYLWVARMIFSGIEFTGKIPFSKVYIHPTLLNKEGKRMSKSLGTGIDPLELIEKYGADATRFGIAWQLTGLQDLRFKEDTINASRKFCNKIWNATRFVMMNLENSKQLTDNSKQIEPKTDADKKILSQLDKLITSTEKDINDFNFGAAAQNLYHFFWNEFCDKYLENSKTQMQDKKLKENTQKILFHVLTNSLQLLHPFIPFITEEIWQQLGNKKPLIISNWPKID
jgi:valyl-tRNA synthetase